jgi:hypothetical protein
LSKGLAPWRGLKTFASPLRLYSSHTDSGLFLSFSFFLSNDDTIWQLGTLAQRWMLLHVEERQKDMGDLVHCDDTRIVALLLAVVFDEGESQ